MHSRVFTIINIILIIIVIILQTFYIKYFRLPYVCETGNRAATCNQVSGRGVRLLYIS